ncbi:hypothetical protein EXIGLDRAFT_761945 [Exidia glandulosa HHB12029]|uniref:WD40 repeat-like protein n=1 Tax=Exidia glandulosa HHB12029 TaxID=1314781 RepID=A0A165N1L6_EXIGL|nr:hypothetical protein EXIGLDRAFT_761945 [Exidia glandulosa HHB12029]
MAHPLVYKKTQCLDTIHKSSIVALAFSPCAGLLASAERGIRNGPTDCVAHLVVWNLAMADSRPLRYALKCSFGLSNLIWFNVAQGVLLGGADGSVTAVQERSNEHKISVFTFDAHESSISALAAQHKGVKLATADGRSLAVWTNVSQKWTLCRRLSHHSSLENRASGQLPPFVVTALSWSSDTHMIVAYTEHPAVILDTQTGDHLRELHFAADGPRVTVGAFGSGLYISYNGLDFNVHDLGNATLKFSFGHASTLPLPAVLAHEEHALFHGTRDGSVLLRDCQKSLLWQPYPVVELRHTYAAAIASLATFSMARTDKYMLAAGTDSIEGRCSIDVWQSFPVDDANPHDSISPSFAGSPAARRYRDIAVRLISVGLILSLFYLFQTNLLSYMSSISQHIL